MLLFWFITPSSTSILSKKGLAQPSPTFPSADLVPSIGGTALKPRRTRGKPKTPVRVDPAIAESKPIPLRVRLLAVDPDALSDQELTEIALDRVVQRRTISALVRLLLARFGSFAGVLAAPRADLQAIDGLGESGVTALKTVHAAAQRLIRAQIINRPLLNNWDRLMEYLIAVLAHERVEHLRVLFLDTRNRLLADETLGRGTVNHTPVYPREVLKRSLELNATALILVHNHPGGDLSPSLSDLEMTREVREAALAIGIVLHDHVIIGNGNWLSLRCEGFL